MVFLTKYLAELTLFRIFAVDYYNDNKTIMCNNYHKLYVLGVLCLSSIPAFAQQENMETLFDPPHLMAYLVAALQISVFVMIFYNRVYFYREREVGNKSQRMNAQLALVLDSNKTQVWTYDNQKNLFNFLSIEDGSTTGLLPIDFSQAYDRDDFLQMRELIAKITKGEEQPGSIFVRGATPRTKIVEQPIYEIDLSVMRHDHKGRPTVILGIQTDITEDKVKSEKAQNLMLRYRTVFNSSLIDMFFYDENGILTDVNDKALETFRVSDREALLKRKVKLTDIVAYRDLDFENFDDIQLCSITDIDMEKKADERVPEISLGGKLYYEMMLTTFHDEDDHLNGIMVAGQDITDWVEENHHQKENTKLLEQTTQNVKDYIENINYSLKVSKVLLMNYNPDIHELKISSDLNKTLYNITQLRAITIVDQSQRRKAKGLFRRMDSRHPGAINDTLRTVLHDKDGRSIYLTFNVMPIRGKDGQITHYFGMCRDVTEMTYTEMRLREETAKAQETEKLKNAFLLNMSYELRTPLNAVVGFAELFNGEHAEEDEPVFAEEIKKNTGNLLELINDILYISRLDAHMIEFNYQEEDFAMLFDGWCYMGWSSLGPGVKVTVENPYSSLMARIDSQNLGTVVQKLCTFAVIGMTEGAVRAKYDYRRGELMITIENTGHGITQADLPHVFERFVRSNETNEHFGSGLDLPIVKELVTQMGGTIELQSEAGKGSAFYIGIPCEASKIERKIEEERI